MNHNSYCSANSKRATLQNNKLNSVAILVFQPQREMAVIVVMSTVLCLLLVYFAVSYKLKRRHMEKLAAAIPGLPALPIIGNAHELRKITSVEELWETIKEGLVQYDNIQKFWFGPKLFIALSNPSYIEAVLSNPKALEKDSIYKIFTIISAGIFTAKGKMWQTMRKPLNKLLHPKIVENCQEIFVCKAEKLCEKLLDKIGQGPFEINEMISFCTLEIICATYGGVQDITDDEFKRCDLPSILSRALNIAFHRAVKLQYYSKFIFDLSEMGKRQKKLEGRIHDMSRLVKLVLLIEKRINILKSREDEVGLDMIECYSDVILNIGKAEGLNIDQMAYLTTDFLVAGFDTTSVAISTLILFLAVFPEYQEKVYDEQLNIFGESDRPPTSQDVHAMSYLTMVFKETVRHVGIPGIVRTLGSDIKLDEYLLPENATVYLSFYQMHHDPRYWEFPDKFHPDHFLPDREASRPKGTFLPFSSGPRGCPGKRFSDLSVKTIVSMLVRKYKFTTPVKPETIKFKYSLMLESSTGYHVEISHRKQKF